VCDGMVVMLCLMYVMFEILYWWSIRL